MKHVMGGSRFEGSPGNVMIRTLFFTIVGSLSLLLAMAGCRSVPVAPDGLLDSEARTRDPAAESDPAALAARINGEPLTYEALERQFDLYFALSGESPEYKREVSLEAFLQRYVLELLLLQEAREAEVTVTPEAVDEEISSYFARSGLTPEAAEERLGRAGLGMADVRRFFGNNRLIDNWSRIKFKEVTVSDDEVRAYYDGNPDYFHIPESVVVRQILICHEEIPSCESGLTKAAAEELAESLRKRATAENFAALAEEYSTDSTAEKGGWMGAIFKGFSTAAFESEAFSLAEGEISDVVETEAGYHLILVTEKRDAGDTPFESVRDVIREDLLTANIQTALLEHVMQLRADAQVELFDLEGRQPSSSEESADPAVSDGAHLSDGPFPTFQETGMEACSEEDGRPLILLFSSASCSHCEWVGGAFDAIVLDYMDRGLIEAHHYEMSSGDDLLTEAVETEVPKDHMKIGKTGDPDGYLPYFNFGCRYHRIGTGYEEEDDLSAEAEEMVRVIEALLP